MGRYGRLLLAYTVLFVAFVSLGAKKDNRYLLPVYPILNILAAFGLVQILDLITAQQSPDDVAGDKLILHGYRQADTRPGVLSVQLIWENRRMSEEEEDGLWATLQHASGSKALSWQQCTLAPGFSQAEAGRPGALAEVWIAQ